MKSETKLNNLAARANEAHSIVLSHLYKAVFHAKDAGDALRAAKPQVGHGNWLKWLKANFDASAETARVYMRVSEYWDTTILPAMDKDDAFTLERARQILRRPPSEIEDGVMPRAKPWADMSRGNLCYNFKKWLENIPEEGVILLHNCWEQVMVVFEDRVWEEMHKHAKFEIPPRARDEFNAETN